MLRMLAAAPPFDWATFQYGLLAGAAAVFVSGILALWLPNDRPGTIGLPMAIAGLGVLRWQLGSQGVPLGVFAACALLAVATELIGRATPRQLPSAFLLVLPGAVAFAGFDVAGLSVGTRLACGIGAAAMAISLRDFDQRHERDGFAVAFLLLTCAAPLIMVRASVAGPALLGAVVLFVILLFPAPQARLGNAGCGAVAVTYWWTIALIAQDSGPRVSAGWVALGFLGLEPMSRAIIPESIRRQLRRNDKDARWIVTTTAMIAQGSVVVFGVAVTARRPSLDVALLTMLPVAIAGVLLATVVVPTPRKKRRSRSREL